jgi:AraC-like DNA-binding protein
MRMHRAHIRDFQETCHLLEQVYTCRPVGPARHVSLLRCSPSLDAAVHIAGPKAWPIVRLRYGAAVVVETDLHDMIVVKKCLQGNGRVHQHGRRANWQPGSIIPLDGSVTRLDLGPEFSTIALPLNSHRLEQLCSRWLGHPLDQELRFSLTPFSDTLQRAWDATLTLIEATTQETNTLPSASAAALEEFVLTLLLRGHPHTYSDELERPDRHKGSRLVKRARQFVEEHTATELTPSKVAAGIGVSVRALQAGFREWQDVTPTEYLRGVRLQRARERLLSADPGTTVTDAALDQGFFHLGRFSQHYKKAFGESPAVTLTRTQRLVRTYAQLNDC